MLIDTHAHLTDEEFEGAGGIIRDMPADRLEKIITVGYDLDSSREGLKIAETNADIYCAVGVHPNNAQSLRRDVCDDLLALTAHEKTVAVGEIGLDYHYHDTDRDKQYYWLNRQLDIVEECGLPVCFHVREAYEDMETIVRARRKGMRGGGVMHCFSGSKETALLYADMGFYISFAGAVTFKNARKFPEIIKSLPLECILIETDAPYLTPHPYRGKINYPKYVAYTAARIAEILDMDVAEVERITTQNAYRAFPKMKV